MGRSDALGEYRPAKSSKLHSPGCLLGRNRLQLERPLPREDQPFTCACHAIDWIAREGIPMKNKWIIAGLIAVLALLGAATAAAQASNPNPSMKRGPTTSEQLAASGDQSKKLASELQAILPPKT